jgi:general secretion pathway protein H
MRTWETGMAIRAIKGRGFSLLELLLTLVVIGLITSLAGVGISSGSRPYQVDAALRHFADVAEYALDEAQLSGTDMGLFIEQRSETHGVVYSYQWMQRQQAEELGWQLAPFDEDAYGRRDMPLEMDVLLEVEQGSAQVAASDIEGSGDDEEEPVQPQVVFYSSGETTPGIMTWVDTASGEVLWELEWDLLGRMSLRRRGQSDED